MKPRRAATPRREGVARPVPRPGQDQRRRAAGDQRAGRRWDLSRGLALFPDERSSQSSEEEADDDLYGELPEGWDLELVDPDARRSERPDLGDEVDVPRRHSPALRFWAEDGRLEFEVVAEASLDTNHGVLDAEFVRHLRTLRGVGAALVATQSAALESLTLLGALESLRPQTQDELATRGGTSGGTLSKYQSAIIETPHWKVPLHFFWWMANPAQAERVRAAARVLNDAPDEPNTALARRLPGWSVNTLRQDLNLLRQMRDDTDAIARQRRTFPETDWELLRDEIGLPGDRGQLLIQLALIGALELGPASPEIRG